MVQHEAAKLRNAAGLAFYSVMILLEGNFRTATMVAVYVQNIQVTLVLFCICASKLTVLKVGLFFCCSLGWRCVSDCHGIRWSVSGRRLHCWLLAVSCCRQRGSGVGRFVFFLLSLFESF
jgi:hypothetical protein